MILGSRGRRGYRLGESAQVKCRATVDFRPEERITHMSSIAGKKRGNAAYYYLVESARVDGKPGIVSQEYLRTGLAAAMLGGGLGLPDGTQNKEFGAVAAAGGCGRISAWPPSSTRRRAGADRAAAIHRDVPGAGGAEPAGELRAPGRHRAALDRVRPGIGQPGPPTQGRG